MNESWASNRRLEMLFTRLNWPSGLVRERTCTSIAQLLATSEEKDLVFAYLLGWLQNQTLESVTAYTLLPLIRAQQIGWTRTISGRDLWGAITRRSILSWLLIREFDPSSSIPFEESLECSAQAPPFFNTNEFFDKNVQRFLPPIYQMRAETLDKELAGLFSAQWKFEWDELCRRAVIKISDRPLDYWFGHSATAEHTISFDTQMSEVYRSAYLRALARMVTDGLVEPHHSMLLAANACPLDLGEWKLIPSRQPAWWPVITVPIGEIDTTIGEIWHQIEALWHRQTIDENERSWRLAAASGRVASGDVIYEVQIWGLFQRCYSAEQPTSEVIRDWYISDNMNHAQLRRQSLLRFEGTLVRKSIDQHVAAFDGWTLVAAAHYGRPFAVPRWQPWRVHSIAVPIPCIVSGQIECEFNPAALTFHDTGKLIGEWHDWTSGISERRSYGLPSESGNYLLLDAAVVDDFTGKTRSTFCWLCCVTRYYEDDDYRRTQRQVEDFRVLGASQIIRL